MHLPSKAAFGIIAIVLLCAQYAAPPVCVAQEVDESLAGKFELAESYMRAGQFDRAIGLLEDLYSRHPDTYAFFNRLKDAYESTKRYDDAIALVEQQIEREPLPVARWAEHGRLLYLQGHEDRAAASFERAINLAPDSPATYQTLQHVLVELRVFDKAVALLEQGRDRLEQSHLFASELGYLYGIAGNHGRAIEEFLTLLESDERQLGLVRSRLTRTGLSSEVLRQSIPVVERAVRRTPLNRSYRELLAWLYEENEQYDRALEVNRAIDRLESEQGRVLFAFAARASGAGAYEAALEAYRIILERYPESTMGSEAARGIGQMYMRWARSSGERGFDGDSTHPTPHYDRALEAFQSFLDRFPRHGLYPYVLLDVARLHHEVYFNLEAAQQAFQGIVRRYPGHPVSGEAQYELGLIAVSRGQLDDARLVFERLVEELRVGEYAETARYQIALVHFYQGEFEAAATLLGAMEENTSMDVANDAIELKVLLFENKGPDSLQTPLREYARARLMLRQRKLNEADDVLARIKRDFGGHPLSDDADYSRAHILRERGRHREAVAAFGEIPLLYPGSFLADRSLFNAAKILEEDLGDNEPALELYQRILTEYPGSLLLSNVRRRIRILRGDEV